MGIREQVISKRLKQLVMIEEEGYWVSHELKPRDVELSLFTCEQLAERQRGKGFLHRIVIGDGKWVHYSNLKRTQKIMGIARWSYCYVNSTAQRISMAQKSCFVFSGGPA
nr:Mariner Mos1 transposase [Hymenolepis microstoma]